MNELTYGTLRVQSPAFEDNEFIPKKHTGFDVDISPAFQIKNLCGNAVSIAIIMDDLDIPLIKAFNHWLIWNIPKRSEIPENIPYGATVPELGNAVQGMGYGNNRYRGPKQPVFVRNIHRYVFHFFALDCFLDLDCTAGKKELFRSNERTYFAAGQHNRKIQTIIRLWLLPP